MEASLQAKTLKAVGVTDGPLVLMCVKVYHRATPEVGEYTTKNKESNAYGLQFSKTKPVATPIQCQVKVNSSLLLCFVLAKCLLHSARK